MAPSPVRLTHSRSRGELKKLEWDEPLSPYAKVFLQRFRPEDHDCIIHAVIGFDSAVDIDELHNLLHHKIIKLRRFCSIVLQERTAWNGYRWIPVEVDIDMHVEEVDLGHFQFPEGSDPVVEYTNSILPRPLDPTRPLWEMHVLRHPPRAGIAGTLLVRLHHALGDGVSLASLLLELGSTPGGGRPSLPAPRSWSKAPALFGGSLFTLLAFLWNTFFAMTRMLLLMLLPPDQPSPVKAKASVRHLPRRITLSRPGAVPLGDLKIVAAAVRGTVNDVLVMAYALAASLYASREAGWQAQRRTLPPMRLLSVVNLRTPLRSDELALLLEGRTTDKWGTRVGVVTYPLPRIPALGAVKPQWWPLRGLRLWGGQSKVVGERERAQALLEGLRAVMKQTAGVRRSWQAQMMFLAAQLICTYASPQALLWVLTLLTHKVSLGMFNLAGPREEMLFLGSRVKSVHQFVTGSTMGQNLHIMSYAGDLHYSFSVHPGTVPDAEALSRCFADAVQELKSSVTTLGLSANSQR